MAGFEDAPGSVAMWLLTHPRLASTLAILPLVLAAAGCSSPESGRLRTLATAPIVTASPPGGGQVAVTSRFGCIDEDSNVEPKVETATLFVGDRETVRAFYVDEFERSGWQRVTVPGAGPMFLSFERRSDGPGVENATVSIGQDRVDVLFHTDEIMCDRGE